MHSAAYLTHLRREFGAFEACLAGDLSAPVEHCGHWTLYDLADHLGQGNMWAAVAVTDQPRRLRGARRPPRPGGPDELVPWHLRHPARCAGH